MRIVKGLGSNASSHGQMDKEDGSLLVEMAISMTSGIGWVMVNSIKSC